MKLKLFLLATSAVALASCSSDAVVEDNAAGNAIQFGVTTGNASRAASYYCNLDKPAQFNVWAKVKQGDAFKTYFVDESFSLNGGTWTIDGGVERYWPNDEIHFFAAKNNTKYGEGAENFATVNWNNGTPTIHMTVETEASKQQDLLYAYTVSNRSKTDGTGNFNAGKADLNFRHALSQVVFKAQNNNKKIYVEIQEVQVANLNTEGTFTFPTNVTDDKSLNDKHDQSGVITDNDASFGKWGNLSTPAEFTTTGDFGPIAVPCNKKEGENLEAVGVVNLTNNEGTATGEGSVKANEQQNKKFSLIVLPQKLDAWNHTAAPSTTGAYFKVRCTIWNVSGTQVDKNNDVILYNNQNAEGQAQYIYIPVKIDWQVGKKYIYTFVFSEKGHGGYDEHGNDVLIPIEFNVTVDDFAKAQEGFNGTVDADNGN